MNDKSSSAAATSTVFDAQFTAALKALFEEKIAFNQVIGLRIDTLEAEAVTGHIDMQPQLIGHYAHQRLHGGVISAGLDAMGGLAVMVAIGLRHPNESAAQRAQRFGKLGTIDLRVDYLRPAIGERFVLSARLLRLGSRVATTAMEFVSTDGKLLATGAAAYIVS
jgi:uncharacterized protein (TIGR00369 family)